MDTCLGKKLMAFFKAICDTNRNRILNIIKAHGEINANDIIKKINLSQPTVSHHLKIMVDSGVLVTAKKGREIHYQINQEMIAHCCSNFAKEFSSSKKK